MGEALTSDAIKVSILHQQMGLWQQQVHGTLAVTSTWNSDKKEAPAEAGWQQNKYIPAIIEELKKAVSSLKLRDMHV